MDIDPKDLEEAGIRAHLMTTGEVRALIAPVLGIPASYDKPWHYIIIAADEKTGRTIFDSYSHSSYGSVAITAAAYVADVAVPHAITEAADAIMDLRSGTENV